MGETSLFHDDHGLASITLIEIQAAVEAEYGVVVEDEMAARMVSLAAVREVLAEALSAAGAGRT
nr:acyl carrier protein [Amycolatopsis nigrescens]